MDEALQEPSWPWKNHSLGSRWVWGERLVDHVAVECDLTFADREVLLANRSMLELQLPTEWMWTPSGPSRIDWLDLGVESLAKL